jgi:hypothetical protein
MGENYFQIKLPSRCTVYKDVDPAKIEIRTFKGKDEKLIAEIGAENFEKKFVALLKNVMKGIDPIQLTLGDEMYVALWETINSYSKDYYVTHECEHCLQKSEYTIDLSTQIDSVDLPEGFSEPQEVKLPDSGDLIKLRLLRVEDVLKVDEIAKLGQNVWLYRYALSIVDNQGIWDRVSYLENLSSKDIMYIRAFHDKFAHGPKMETSYSCQKCGGTGIMPVPFRLEMLLPYGKTLRRYTGDAV